MSKNTGPFGRLQRLAATTEEMQSKLERAHEALSREAAYTSWVDGVFEAMRRYDNPQSTMLTASRDIARLMNAERAIIYLVEPDGRSLSARVQVPQGSRDVRFRVGEGLVGTAAATGNAVNVKDASLDPRSSDKLDVAVGVPSRSVLCQPLLKDDGRVIGVIEVVNRSSGYFTMEEALLLSRVSSSVVLLIRHNDRSMELLERSMQLDEANKEALDRERRLEILYNLQDEVLLAEEPFEVLETVALGAARSLHAQAVSIALNLGEGETHEYVWEAVGEDNYRPGSRWWGHEFTQKVLERGEAVYTPWRGLDENSYHRPNVDSVLGAPLLNEEETIGVIEVVNPTNLSRFGNGGTGFSRPDAMLLELIAAQMSLVITRSFEREQREREERLSAVGRMLAGVIHDIGAPITAIRGNAQRMSREDDADRRSDLLAKVEAQVKRLKAMTNELLAFSRGEVQVFKRNVDAESFADDLEASIRELMTGFNVRVKNTYRGVVVTDDNKLFRILLNLAKNAKEAMEIGGSYTIEMRREGGWFVIDCLDTGSGIPDELQQRLFDEFVSTKKGGANSGLGLSIVRGFVNELHGGVSFKTEVGVGTRFVVWVPINGEEQGPALRPHIRGPRQVGGRVHTFSQQIRAIEARAAERVQRGSARSEAVDTVSFAEGEG